VTDIEHRSGCGVLLNQSAMIDAGKAHDITPAVLAAMDAKLAPIQVGVPQTTQP
jgi:Skp family chaperone for outer membrane proteins